MSTQTPTRYGFLPEYRGGMNFDTLLIDGEAVLGGVVPAGNSTTVQYNNAGTFAGDDDLVFDSGTATLKSLQVEATTGTASWLVKNANVGGNLTVSGGTNNAGTAGAVSFFSGNSTGFSRGADFVVGGATTSTGGDINIEAGVATGAGITGGGVTITSGSSALADAGSIILTASQISGGAGADGLLQFLVGGITYTWPTDTVAPADGSGLRIASGGGTLAAVLEWTPGLAGAAGADTQVQFNDGGVFAGDAGLTFDSGSGALASTVSVVGGGAVDTTAALAVNSTTKGILPPRMTTAQREAIASPTDGLVVYDSTLSALHLRANSVWTRLMTNNVDYLYAARTTALVGTGAFALVFNSSVMSNGGISVNTSTGLITLNVDKVYEITLNVRSEATPNSSAGVAWRVGSIATSVDMYNSAVQTAQLRTVTSSATTNAMPTTRLLYSTATGGQGNTIWAQVSRDFTISPSTTVAILEIA